MACKAINTAGTYWAVYLLFISHNIEESLFSYVWNHVLPAMESKSSHPYSLHMSVLFHYPVYKEQKGWGNIKWGFDS